MERHRTSQARGFTLIEMLVVLLIILLVSAATLPVAVPAIMHRQVGEAARVLQAALAGARDTAIRANAPRGIRLLPDPSFSFVFPTAARPYPAYAANRFIPIEPAPDYSVGRVSIVAGPAFPTTIYGGPGLNDPPYSPPLSYAPVRIEEAPFDQTGVPNERTSWFWNIRVGDKVRFGDSGNYYTVVGPLYNGPTGPQVANPELFVNSGTGSAPFLGRPGDPSPLVRNYNGNAINVEYLLLTNGYDDNQNGYTDEGYDGLDNNGNGVVDCLNGDFAECEPENFVGPQLTAGTFTNQPYTILRRPVPSQGAREITLPGDVVIDMTGWNVPFPGAAPLPTFVPVEERSRLPVDPFSGNVDVMTMPGGQVVLSVGNANPAPPTNLPFLHFWLTERTDVQDGVPLSGVPYLLPMPKGTPLYPSANDTSRRFLQGDRRLVTLFTHTGQITTNTLENFNGTIPGLPFVQAQLGAREEVK